MTYRERRGFVFLEATLQDVRLAARTLRKSPGYAAAVAITLALAIGANAAMFSVLNAVLLRPLPYRSPEQLAMLWTELPAQNLREGRSAYWNIEQWRHQSRSFADMAFFDPVSVTLTSEAEAEQVSVARISPNFFPLLGVQLMHGRNFSQEEAERRVRLALISHRLWQARFGGSREALGASVEIDGLPSRIIGILPAGFQFAQLSADVWEPYTLFPDWETRRTARGAESWFVVGRLRQGATIEQAQAEMSSIASSLDGQLPVSGRNRGIGVVPLSRYVVGSKSRMALWMLAGAVACVLLIAAVNVASLSLARGAARVREMAVRVALGAGPARIVRQLLAESVTLAAVAGLLGCLLALAAIRVIRSVGPHGLARLNEVSLDLTVLGWASAASLMAGILVGLAPAMAVLRPRLRLAGEAGGRGVSGSVAARGLRRSLVVAEFALAIVLLAGAGLAARSWWNVESVDPGFRPERVLSLQLSATDAWAGARRADFYNRVLEQVQSLPGVEGAGIIGDLFIGGGAEHILTTEGDAQVSPRLLRLRRDEVSPALFKTLGTRLLRGRFFSAEDGPDSPRVAIVNDVLARRVWPGRDPVGRRFKTGAADSGAPWFTVVGVVDDLRRQGLESEPIPQMFEPLAQNPSRLATLLIRTSGEEPLKMLGTLRAAIRRVDKRAPLYGVTTLEARLGTQLVERRLQTWLLIGFAGVALMLAAVGIYGLIQHSVARRTHEIGIRIAVGAEAGSIFRMVIREGLTLSTAGLAIGLVGALWLGQLVAGLLVGVSATDPLTFAAVSLLLTAVAAAACYFPARRAMKLEPVAALRQE